MSDAAQRERALDTTRSFIVQAPAGSGKTELLIQRYLALLSSVDVPEQIVAITFTRKAAAQMRSRIVAALTAAAAAEPPAEPHRRHTYELARRALARSRRCDWSLLQQPVRMKIDTLDALNVWLAQRLPVSTGGIGAARIVENARGLHERAARRLVRCLGDASPVADALQALIRYAAGSPEQLVGQFAALLATRDQWLHYLFADDEADFRRRMEHALERIAADRIAEVAKRLPEAARTQLVPLLQHAARHARNSAGAFEPWRELEALPSPTPAHIGAWRAVPALLLTRNGAWRKRRGLSAVGFPKRFADLSGQLARLLASLAGRDDLRRALGDLYDIPDIRPGPAWWDALAALRIALQHLVAELHLLFAARNEADFVELALAAQRALGSADRPSEWLLALDRRIRHILVDEFQDTSRTQIRLLELLTAGWEPGDGRSLFLVGDPMQSIYRFRNADMALFLRAKHLGIGEIRCEILELVQNFRSSSALVEWVNRAFAGIFPADDDVQAGAAGFSPSVAAASPTGRPAVQVHALRGGDHEAEVRRAAEIVAAESARSKSRSIAVLVRSRSHLVNLQTHLNALGVDAHAVQLEAPNQHQIIHDLMGLARALTQPGDRVAWLGVLRAPWCGLGWRDLHALCRRDADSTVWSLMHDAGRVATLGADARRRLGRTRAVLRRAFHRRGDQSLARWVRRTWVTLDGPACVTDPEDFDRAELFFATLAEIATRGDLDDPAAIERFFDDPAATADRPAASGVEIMSIHRAKGLEFDTVVLLGLGREPPRDKTRALYWHERLHADGDVSVLLAPFPERPGEKRTLTRWIRDMDQRRETSERARLLYVAATRARERLHLVGQLAEGRPAPPSGSLLACLWPQVAAAFASPQAAAEVLAGVVGACAQESVGVELPLRRLVRRGRTAEAADGADAMPTVGAEPLRRPRFDWAGQAALQVGVVVHRWLQVFARDGIACWDRDRVAGAGHRYRAELRLLGVDDEALSWASNRVMQALQSVLEDPTGRWILDSHDEAGSELPVTRVSDGRVERMRLDRTFVDAAGTRWIIDFKTSAHEGGATQAFLDSEVQRYRAQLQRYARTLAAVDARPMRVGLYFPLLRAFRDWRP